MQWFMKAAEQGNADAQFNVGSLYLLSDSGFFNIEKAAIWFQKASEKNVDALLMFGYLCEYGFGVPQNFIVAFTCYTEAYKRGREKEATEALNDLKNHYTSLHTCVH